MTTPTWAPLSREEAIADGWTFRDDGSGVITLAYDEWLWTDREIRQFMHQTRRWSVELSETIWAEVQSSPAGDDEPDALGLFLDRFGGLLPDQHDWMLFGAVVRDAVSAYEVYLGKAIDQAMRHHRVGRPASDRTPGWTELRSLYATLGLNPRPPDVDVVISLRDLLTHRRGELRTPEHRALFAESDDAFATDLAHLTEDNVLGYLDVLGDSVQELDPVLWAYTYKSHAVPAWDKIGAS